MRTIYLAAPLSAPTSEGMAENRLRAARWGVWIAKTFNVAVSADWIWWSTVLEETPENRALGLSRDFAMVERADELWHVIRVSSGVKSEIDHANSKGVLVRDLTSLGEEPPQHLSLADAQRIFGAVFAFEVPNNNVGVDSEDDCG